MKKSLICILSVVVLFCTSCAKNEAPKPAVTTDPTNPVNPPPVTTPPPVTPPPVTTPPAANTVNVGDGKSALVIDGNKTKYAAGTVIVVKAGTYASAITIQNLTGVTVKGTGVILDGLSQGKAGFYNCISLNNLNNVTISGFTTQNNGYKMLYLNSRLVGVTLDNMTFTNCLQPISMNGGTSNWDGTDNTVNLLNFSITNSKFTNCDGVFAPGGLITNGQVTYVMKNFVFAFNTVTGGNPGDIIWAGAADSFSIHDNTITGVNANVTNDNRLFMMVGNGDAYNNKFTNNEGHAIGLWPVSFGSTVETSKFYNNTIIGNTRYSAFEQQEFTAYNIPGKTTKSDLIVDNNIAGNINTDHWTGYPGTLIDIYSSLMGGKVTLTNNKGYNWFPKPPSGVFYNPNSGGEATTSTGNTYTDTAP